MTIHYTDANSAERVAVSRADLSEMLPPRAPAPIDGGYALAIISPPAPERAPELNPAGGWFYFTAYGRPVLSRVAVMAALAVGCTEKAIAAASGVPISRVSTARAQARTSIRLGLPLDRDRKAGPTTRTSRARAAFLDAVKTGESMAAFCERFELPYAAVWTMEQKLGLRLRRERSRRSAFRGGASRNVLRCLEKHGPQTTSAIMDSLAVTHSSAKLAVYWCHASGYIAATNHARPHIWDLTEKGRQWLSRECS